MMNELLMNDETNMNNNVITEGLVFPLSGINVSLWALSGIKDDAGTSNSRPVLIDRQSEAANS
jgi:hypothetical protein